MSESQVTSPSGLSLLSDHRSTRSCCLDASSSACDLLLSLPFVSSAAVLLTVDGGIEILHTKSRTVSDKASPPLSPLPSTVLPVDCMPECIKTCFTAQASQIAVPEDTDALKVLGIVPTHPAGVTALCSPVITGATTIAIVVISVSLPSTGLEPVQEAVASATNLLKFALINPPQPPTPTPPLLVAGAMEVCQSVQQSQTVVGVLSSSLAGLQSLLSATVVELFLFDTNRLARIYSTDQLAFSSPYQDQHVSFLPLTAPGDSSQPHSIVAAVSAAGQTLSLGDVSTHPSYRASVDGPAHSSGMFVPLLSAIGTVIGVVKVLRQWPFGADDILITGFITEAVGGALRALVLRSELQSARHCADSILSCLTEATTVVYNDVIDFSNHMLDLARPCLQAQLVSVFLVDRTRQQLWCAAAATEGSPTTRPSSDGTVFGTGTRLSMFKGVLGNVVSTGNPIRLSSLSGDIVTDVLLEDKLGHRISSLLCAPIVDTKRRVIGVLLAVNKQLSATSELSTVLPVVPQSAHGVPDAVPRAPTVQTTSMASPTKGEGFSLMSPSELKRAKLRMYQFERQARLRRNRRTGNSGALNIGPVEEDADEDDEIGDDKVRAFASPDVLPMTPPPSGHTRKPSALAHSGGKKSFDLDASVGSHCSQSPATPVETIWDASDPKNLSLDAIKLSLGGQDSSHSLVTSSQSSPVDGSGKRSAITPHASRSRILLQSGPESKPRRRSGIVLSSTMARKADETQQHTATSGLQVNTSFRQPASGNRSLSSPPQRDLRPAVLEMKLMHSDVVNYRGTSQPPASARVTPRGGTRDSFSFGSGKHSNTVKRLLQILAVEAAATTSDADVFVPVPFTEEDARIAKAVCIEIGATLSRGSIDVMLHRESEYTLSSSSGDAPPTPRRMSSMASMSSFVSSFYSQASAAVITTPQHGRNASMTSSIRLPIATPRRSMRQFHPVSLSQINLTSPLPTRADVPRSPFKDGIPSIESDGSRVISPLPTHVEGSESSETGIVQTGSSRLHRKSKLSNMISVDSPVLGFDDNSPSEEQCAIATAETMPPLVLEELLNWKANAAARAGVARDKVGLDPVFKDWRAVHLPDYNGWLFEPWAVQLTDLPYAIPRILQEWDLITQFSIDESTLLRFSHVVRHRYTDRNAFHNFYHAISVMQTVHVMLLDCGLKSSLDGIAVFGVLIAALCHDLDHPGVNNALLAGCGSDLACLYNDVSILENHHTAVAWEILRTPETNVLKGISAPEVLKRFRTVMVECILATDMTKHADIIAETTELPEWSTVEQPCAPALQSLLGKLLVHLGDLNAQALSGPLALQWGGRVIAEFQAQAALEVLHPGVLAVTPYMHDLHTDAGKARLQLGFCNYVLQPLWQAASDVFPALRPRLEQLRANAATYDAIVNPEAPSAAVSQVSSPGDEGSVTLRVDSSDCDDS